MNECMIIYAGDVEGMERYQKRLVSSSIDDSCTFLILLRLNEVLVECQNYPLCHHIFKDSNLIFCFLTQVKVTPKHNEECKRLLTLMGIPYVNVCNVS